MNTTRAGRTRQPSRLVGITVDVDPTDATRCEVSTTYTGYTPAQGQPFRMDMTIAELLFRLRQWADEVEHR